MYNDDDSLLLNYQKIKEIITYHPAHHFSCLFQLHIKIILMIHTLCCDRDVQLTTFFLQRYLFTSFDIGDKEIKVKISN